MIDALSAFNDRFAACPLVAVLRGIAADEVERVGDAPRVGKSAEAVAVDAAAFVAAVKAPR
jgi:hypothetical protein